MIYGTFSPRTLRRTLRLPVIAAVAGLGFLSTQLIAQEAAVSRTPGQSELSYTVETLATGVNNGYQLAMDPVNRRVYFSDAQWRVEERADDGTISVQQSGSGKLVEFDAATRTLASIHSFLNLTRNDGNGREGEPFNWDGVTAGSMSSMRTTFSPYGVDIDPLVPNAAGQADPVIITTTARGRDSDEGYGGNVVIYRASQGAPTDADRLFEFEDGTPIFNGIRRVTVNTQTHKAFITNMGSETIPGYIAVIDLASKRVDARVAIPGNQGVIGAAVDAENNLVYVGTMRGEKLYVIDVNLVDNSDPKDFELNNSAVFELNATVGANARPTYNAELKRVYVSSFSNPAGRISIVNADPGSESYGRLMQGFETGATNMVEVDVERGLLYSANLGDREVVVFDLESYSELLRLPTTGNALNIAIDPVTRDVWVSNFSDASAVDIFRVQRP